MSSSYIFRLNDGYIAGLFPSKRCIISSKMANTLFLFKRNEYEIYKRDIAICKYNGTFLHLTLIWSKWTGVCCLPFTSGSIALIRKPEIVVCRNTSCILRNQRKPPVLRYSAVTSLNLPYSDPPQVPTDSLAIPDAARPVPA